MARTDAIVLGAGIVGTSAALHLAKRGLSVALVDRGGPGEQTSYGNAGIIEGNTYFPYPMPPLRDLLRIALKRAPEANYHFSFLPKLAPWLWAYRAASRPEKMLEFAQGMRPLFAAALAEHESLMAESGALAHLARNGWLKLNRDARDLEAMRAGLDAVARAGISFQILDRDGALSLEPSLAPRFAGGVFWPAAASVDNPLAVTRAYAARFGALGGIVLEGDARSLHRAGRNWRVDTANGPVDSPNVVNALGPWGADLLAPLGIRLPFGVKRGYHLHFKPRNGATLSRPVEAGVGYVVAPMQQGLRLTTGAEFAARDAPPTPVQFDRLLDDARALFPLGEQVEKEPWLGRRPTFPDSKPVIGRVPGHDGLWVDFGHAHWGLTLGPVSGRLLAEMVTGQTPFCDPKPYAIERFLR